MSTGNVIKQQRLQHQLTKRNELPAQKLMRDNACHPQTVMLNLHMLEGKRNNTCASYLWFEHSTNNLHKCNSLTC